jgi:site-specific DNA recombinase
MACYEIVDDEARIVRQIFTWVGRDGCSLAEVARRLEQQGVRTRTGRPRWQAATLWCMLTHTTYRGQARFGRTRVGERRPTLRPRRGQAEVPKRMSTRYAQPATEHLVIAVPALVDAELFAAAQEQLAAHRLHLRRRRGTRFLLQGLAVCAECGYGMYAKSSCGGPSYEYAYYRCRGSDGSRFGGRRVCDNPMQRRELMDETVWQDVCGLLREPGRLQQEYERRCHPSPEARVSAASEVERLRTAVVKVKQGTNRLIDAYSEGLVERTDFEPRIRHLKNRLAKLQAEQQALQEQVRQEQERSLIFSRWDEFVEQIQQSLTTADWPKRREIVRTLVKRVEVAKNHLRIVYKVPDRPFANHSTKGVVPYCLGVHQRR